MRGITHRTQCETSYLQKVLRLWIRGFSFHQLAIPFLSDTLLDYVSLKVYGCEPTSPTVATTTLRGLKMVNQAAEFKSTLKLPPLLQIPISVLWMVL